VCGVKYKECALRFYWNTSLFKEMTSYAGWSLFGSASEIFKNQGITILLNQYFNPVLTAARSIAVSVNGVLNNFPTQFNAALSPQIIKNFAAKQKTRLPQLVFSSAKGTYFLIYFFALPLVLEMPEVLSLWLKNPPAYTAAFTRLALFDILAGSLSLPIITAVQATGKIRLYQAITGCMVLLNLPSAWLLLSFGCPPYSVMISAICVTCAAFAARLLILQRLMSFFSILRFLRRAIVPVCVASAFSAVLPVLAHKILPPGLLRLCAVTGISIASTGLCVYKLGLNKNEREAVKNLLRFRPRRNKGEYS
jgi:O-antigen/teichoic acid export membrane protein